MPITVSALCLVSLVLCNVHNSLEHGIPRRSFLTRRAIDGTRGRKYFDPEEEGTFDSYGSAGGQYDPYQEKTDFSDIRRNVPGEPRVDYPAYTTLPQTGFTCEGRSRGYYADEVSGCQVFHVCHDVLVSSFLCPIGSIFSQKLLTCDWWTKVDCASSGKYTDVNRNSYQQDDDEMIRNAYAMISLQSGTDVTKDGLVDPDRTGSVIDYQNSPGRILDYSSVDTTGNDLKSSFEDYSTPASRDFQPPYQLKDRKVETSRSYHGKFYSEGKFRSPYEDSPIIRVQKINDPNYKDQRRNKDYDDTYARDNEFTHKYQPSYAPTVPTVTTTTRRFYSPTVPTTFRPSTLAYNKLDQVIDSSDYYFSQSRGSGFVTPPTRVFSSSSKSGQDFGGVSLRKRTRDHDYARQESYEDDYEEENSEEARNEKPKERFQVRVAEDYNFNRTGSLYGRNPFFVDGIYRGSDLRNRAEEDVSDDFETRGSIGLGQALHKSFRGISVQEQNPVKEEIKDDDKKEVNYQHTLTKPESTNYSVGIKEKTTEQYQRDSDVTSSVNVLVSTTPSSIIDSTTKASTSLQELSKPNNIKNPTDNVDSGFHTHKPITELPRLSERPQPKFQIKVPDLPEVSTLFIKHSALDDNSYSEIRTTELPRFEKSTFSDDYVDEPTSFDKTLTVTSNYENLEDSTRSSLHSFPTTVVRPFIPSNSGNVDVKISQKNYDEDSHDIIEFDKHSHSKHEANAAFGHGNNTDETIERDYETSSYFNTNESSEYLNSKSPIGESTTSTSKTIETTIPSSFSRSSTIETSEDNLKQDLNRAPSSSVINSSATESWPVTHKSVEGLRREISEHTVEASTINTLFRPKSLQQIEETIEKNNSPYQLTLTVNRNEDVIRSEPDFISKLITEQGKESSTLQDRVHELEILKSVESEIHGTKELETTTTTRSPAIKNNSKPHDRFSAVIDDLKGKRNLNTVSLLQLMSELLKLDKVPRPFSLADSQVSELRPRSNVQQNVYSTTDVKGLQEDTTSSFERNVDEVKSEISVPRSKEHLLGKLTENLGEPIYRKDVQPVFDLPEKAKSVNFESDLSESLNVGINDKKLDNDADFHNSTVSTVPQTSSEATVTTSTQKIMLTTESEKTVVKTEFVPSIGFSLDTDEGREEYVEAVLGGLIEPQAAESEKKETILKEEVKDESLSKKNETSRQN